MTQKTNKELAREAGFADAEYWPDDFKGLHGCVTRFATLVEQRLLAKLLEGVGEPMLRYEPEIWREDRIKMEPDEQGDWVRYDQLAAAVLAYKQDAERYRWLREQNANLESGFSVNYEEVGLLEELQWIGSDLDAVIDAAIRGATT